MSQTFNITYKKSFIKCRKDETLLNAFFRNKIDAPFSCRNGSCQACLTHVKSGIISPDSQKSLSSKLKKTNHILLCSCIPLSDMVLEEPISENTYVHSKIKSISSLCKNIKEVTIEMQSSILKYKTGQFINIKSTLDNKVRSYSLTSIFRIDNCLKFHVQEIKKGVFSHWVFNQAQIGDDLLIHYPLGECCNSRNLNISNKLFIATGSGLGACIAIISEILDQGYDGNIELYHSSKNQNGLYKTNKLEALINQFPNLSFKQYVPSDQSEKRVASSAYVDQIAMNGLYDMSEYEVYLYGNPIMVRSAIKIAISKKCKDSNIFSDAFEYGQSVNANDLIENQVSMEFIEERRVTTKPNLEMWNVLTKENRLNKILDDFYTKVLSDEWLSPFFKGVTKQHIIGKQYAFLNQVYTGKDCYFGDRPRNAHHWMVISNQLFDYREMLFKQSCQKFGLPEPFLSQLLDFDESFRAAIVKNKVWPRISNGEILPIKGFQEIKLEIGSLCNICELELAVGELVHYHDRTGEIYCQNCKQGDS